MGSGWGLASTRSSPSASQAGRKHCRTPVRFRKNLAGRLLYAIGVSLAPGCRRLLELKDNPASAAYTIEGCQDQRENMARRLYKVNWPTTVRKNR